MKGFQILVDAQIPSKLARFWAEALPNYKVRPYDAREIERLASIGLTLDTDTSVPIVRWWSDDLVPEEPIDDVTTESN